jgi:2-polyprenyl-3-methyl-5-hydroxy-6-metoxy-1,4-benzoquinol methylase
MKKYNKETALEYDNLRSGHQLKRKLNIIKDFLGDQENFLKCSIAEIGAGSGRLMFLLASHFKKNHITGFEINRGFVDYARSNFILPNLNFSHLDIEKQGTNKKFDVLITIDVLHHLKNLENGIKNIKNSLKKDGEWIIIEPNIYNPYIYFFQLTGQGEKPFYQKKTEKELIKYFSILSKKYAITIPFWIKNPSAWLKNLENKLENKKLIGGSVVYRTRKN